MMSGAVLAHTIRAFAFSSFCCWSVLLCWHAGFRRDAQRKSIRWWRSGTSDDLKKDEVIDEHTLARPKIRGANDGQEFERDRDCGGGAGAGNWRERSDFLGCQRGALATATLCGP